MKLNSLIGLGTVIGVVSVVLLLVTASLPVKWKQASTWRSMSSPGPLSVAHMFLKDDCESCHTTNKGVQSVNCITCHANNVALLGRQPTAFHGDITTCSPCHLEHQNGVVRPTKMDHSALANIGLSQLNQTTKSDSKSSQILSKMNRNAILSLNAKISPIEATLNCAKCHDTKDRHLGFFGKDCASCHNTVKWTIPEYQHPSPSSRDCVQCHKAPPSHNMMHFKMISMTVAKQPNATVNECFKCHQTTVWNDIKGVGWYKHH